jgi:glycosyltransferase involved in cell wall biosynthesis
MTGVGKLPMQQGEKTLMITQDLQHSGAEDMPTHAGNLSPLPHLADVGVISLVPDIWGGPWQPRQQILTRLARYFHVVWCNPARRWWRLWPPYSPRRRDIIYDDAVSPGFNIYQPEPWLPAIGRPAALARVTMRERLRRAQQLLARQGCRTTILYIWRPWYGLALDAMEYNLSCYHIDDEYTFSASEKPIEAREAQLISRVDQVFIHSPALLEKKGELNPHTIFVPNGVDYQAYVTPQREPADLRPIPHPRIGYTGIIKKQVDFSLLIDLAERHPQWSFVLVGPQGNLGDRAALLQRLSQLPNVYLLGGKAVAALPAYVQHMDVCILSYETNEYTKFIYPLKLHEYLASGRPVVGSPIRSLQEFGHVIRLAKTVDEWSSALNDMLSPTLNAAVEVEARQSIARRHDWNILVQLIVRTWCSRLGPAYVERFDEIPPNGSTTTPIVFSASSSQAPAQNPWWQQL